MVLKKIRGKNKFLQQIICKSSSKGKKQQAERVVLNALRFIKLSQKHNLLTLEPFLLKIFENLEPRITITSKKIGGMRYKIPVYANDNKELTLSVTWLVKNSCGRNKETRKNGLIKGFCDTWSGVGAAITEKKDLHELGLDNRAYIRYL